MHVIFNLYDMMPNWSYSSYDEIFKNTDQGPMLKKEGKENSIS